MQDSHPAPANATPPAGAPAGPGAQPRGDSRPGRSACAPQPVNLSSQSVAGEEDPGASLDSAAPSGMLGLAMSSGDEAPPGTPGTGEVLCRKCRGSGQVEDGPCPACDGIGSVIAGVGGA